MGGGETYQWLEITIDPLGMRYPLYMSSYITLCGISVARAGRVSCAFEQGGGSLELTEGKCWTPPQNLLDHGVDVWKVIVIVEVWQPPLAHAVDLLLSADLDLGVEHHSQHEAFHRRHRLLWSHVRFVA